CMQHKALPSYSF
nr:immunoglobulin light chain junction region [Macaca mulatta]